MASDLISECKQYYDTLCTNGLGLPDNFMFRYSKKFIIAIPKHVLKKKIVYHTYKGMGI